MDFTALKTTDYVVRPSVTDPGSMKKLILLRLILKGRVVVSKRAISAIRGGNGAGGHGFIGF